MTYLENDSKKSYLKAFKKYYIEKLIQNKMSSNEDHSSKDTHISNKYKENQTR